MAGLLDAAAKVIKVGLVIAVEAEGQRRVDACERHLVGRGTVKRRDAKVLAHWLIRLRHVRIQVIGIVAPDSDIIVGMAGPPAHKAQTLRESKVLGELRDVVCKDALADPEADGDHDDEGAPRAGLLGSGHADSLPRIGWARRRSLLCSIPVDAPVLGEEVACRLAGPLATVRVCVVPQRAEYAAYLGFGKERLGD